jgi:ankyrin repeat protein
MRKAVICIFFLLVLPTLPGSQINPRVVPLTPAQQENMVFWNKLYTAVLDGDIARINKYWAICIKRGVDPTGTVQNAKTEKTIRALEKLGVDITKSFSMYPYYHMPFRETMMETACLNGFYEAVEYLAKKAPSLINDKRNWSRVPPLSIAIRGGGYEFAFQGRSEIVRLLVRHGALVDEMDMDGITPLMTAAAAGDAGSFKVLLDAGALDGLKTNKGETVDEYINELAKDEYTRETAGQLKKILENERAKRSIATKNSNNDYAHWLELEQAIAKGDEAEIRKQWTECQNRNIDMDEVILSAQTPETVKLLEYLGADIIKAHPVLPMGRSLYAITLIYAACRDGNKDLVAYLLASDKMDVQQTDERWGRSLLHITMAGRSPVDGNERLEIVRLLLAKGANMDALDCEGRTPLFLALDAGDIKSFQKLINMGASYSIIAKNKWGLDEYIKYYSRSTDKSVLEGVEKMRRILEARRAKQTIPGKDSITSQQNQNCSSNPQNTATIESK